MADAPKKKTLWEIIRGFSLEESEQERKEAEKAKELFDKLSPKPGPAQLAQWQLSPPTTIPDGVDYQHQYDHQYDQTTTFPEPLQLEDENNPDRAGGRYDNPAALRLAIRRGERYAVWFKHIDRTWAVVDAADGPKQLVAVPHPSRGSWDGVRRAEANCVCEMMNAAEQVRLVEVEKEKEVKRKQRLDKPVHVPRSWHRNNRGA